MFTTLLLPLMFVTPTAETPQPIGPSMIELVISDPSVSVPLCESYSAVIDAVDSFGLDYSDAQVFVNVADAYAIVSMEGDSFRLDNEARDAFTTWLHTSCS